MVREGRAAFVLLAALIMSGCQQTPPVAGGEIRLTLALQYLAMGEYAAAQRNLQRAQRALPGDYRPLLAQARIYQTQGHDAMANVWYTQAEEMAPKNGYVLNNYGAFLCALGQYDNAQARFSLAAQSRETESWLQARWLSGLCFLDQGKGALARDTLQTVAGKNRSVAEKLLTEATARLQQNKVADAGLLLATYDQWYPDNAERLWLKILYAARQNASRDVSRYGEELARTYPLSIQYQRYLANEY